MGSIACHREKGMSDKAFFEREYESVEVLGTGRVGGVIYAAARKRGGDGEVFALVMPFTTRYSARSRGDGSYDVHNFSWKEQDETVGPYDAECPERILGLLSPTDDERSNEWRARCRENALARTQEKARAAVVTAGTTIETVEPVYYGKRYGYFKRFVYSGKGATFTALREDGTFLVSLSNWKRREYAVVS